jgi:non-haem Fe2+, alpha-ketoglutarate-dependent halogenase
MTRLLSPTERICYQRDGVVFPIPVLDAAEAGEYRRRCDELEGQLGGRPRTIEVRQMHLHFPWAYQLATQPRILDAVESLLGPDLLVCATKLFAKHPHDQAVSVGWHRDRTYIGLTADHTTTAWVALADSNLANGCMCAVPGPDRMFVPALEELRAGSIQAGIVNIELRAGEMSLHDADVPHGSAANRSGQKRVGFVIRYITPEARPAHGRPPVILARGQFRGDWFQIQGPPDEAAPEHAVAQMKQSAALHLDAVLGNLRGGKV